MPRKLGLTGRLQGIELIPRGLGDELNPQYWVKSVLGAWLTSGAGSTTNRSGRSSSGEACPVPELERWERWQLGY
jgi:hypothetical protein